MESRQQKIDRYAKQTSECNDVWFFGREEGRIPGSCTGANINEVCPLRVRCKRHEIKTNPTIKHWIKADFYMKRVPVLNEDNKIIMIDQTPKIIEKFITVKEPMLDKNNKPVYEDEKAMYVDKIISIEEEAKDKMGRKIMEGGTSLLKDEYRCENYDERKR